MKILIALIIQIIRKNNHQKTMYLELKIDKFMKISKAILLLINIMINSEVKYKYSTMVHQHYRSK